MKPNITLTVQKKALHDAALSASKASISPSRCKRLDLDFIYSCIVFRLNDYFTMYAMASDSKRMITVPVALLDRKGDTTSFAVRTDEILPIINLLDDQELVVDIYSNSITFHHSYGTFTLPLVTEGLDAFLEKRTELEKLPARYSLDIESSFFFCALKRLRKYVRPDELRPVLDGICIHRHAGKIDFVASDGWKLIKITKTDTECTLSTKLLISREDMEVIRYILPRTGIVSISYTEPSEKETDNKPICRMLMDNKTEYWFSPNEGRFPDYSKVIPAKFKCEARIHRTLLMKSLNRLSYFCPVSNIVRVALQNGKATLFTEDKDFKTSSSEHLSIEHNGTNARFGLKIDNVTDLLKSLPGEEIRLKSTGKPDAAVVVIPDNQPEDQEITTLFMPCVIDSLT